MKKIAVLWNAKWPVIDAPRVTLAGIKSLFEGFEIEIISKPVDGSRLKPGSFDTLVLLNGSAFPLEFWEPVTAFLKGGGNLFYLGGNPFSRPFRMVGGIAKIEPPTPAYARVFGIVQSFELVVTSRHDVDPPWKKAGLSRCWRFFYRLNEVVRSEAPDQPGWQGSIEARVRSLARVMRDGCHVASAAVLVTHEGGLFKDSRWLLVPCQLDRHPPAEIIRELTQNAMSSCIGWSAKPSLAVYRPEERPRISVRSLHRAGRILIRISSKRATVLERECASVESIALPKGLPKGTYKIECIDTAGEIISANGFWIAEPGDLCSGRRLGVSADWLTRGGKPFAVAGTTYMCGEEHRDFLNRPNPASWLRDMEAMKNAGTNMLRTGLWQKWEPLSHADGRPRLETLRAFEAFLLCAGQHDLPVIFDFFSFVPHAWGAQHPYLDPKALDAQKRFLGGFASVAKACDFVAWDLINEPSVAEIKHVWSTRPVGGNAEKKAWLAWINREYGGLEQARLAWQMPPDWAGAPPLDGDFVDSTVLDKRHPLLACAFQRFAQETFCNWTRILALQLRKSGAPFHLVTVGQDEGGSNTRPSPLFHGDLVDFTSNHSWHYNDDLLWDTIVAHKRGVPLLIEEVGVMPHRFLDRSSSRDLAAYARLLERKLTLSFGAGAAGFIEWLWNINSYLPSDGEAAIGLLMADGAEKPEMRVYAAMAEFAGQLDPWLGKVEDPSVCVVYPQGDSFSARPRSIESHQRAVKSLEYALGLPTRVIGEYQSGDLGNPKLIVVPAHESLADTCWKDILQAVRRGSWLAVSGDIRRGADYRLLGRLDFLVQGLEEGLVSNVERLRIGKKQYEALFPLASVKPFRKLAPHGANRVLEQTLGKGTILFSPLPLEGSVSDAPLLEFYRSAAVSAGLAVVLPPAGCLCRRVALPKADLYALINETSADVPLRNLLPRSCKGDFTKGLLAPGRCALYLIEKKSNRCVAAYQTPYLE